MGSKSARRAHREKARRRKQGLPGTSDAVEGPPALWAESSTEALQLLADTGSVQAAGVAARDMLGQAVDHLVELLEPYDGWDLIELLRIRTLPISGPPPDGRTESVVSVIELVALVAASRREHPDGKPGKQQELAAVVDAVYMAAAWCLRIGALVTAFSTAADGGPLARLQTGTVVRETLLRNVAYPHMVRDTLRDLFGDPAVESACRAVLGFSAEEAVAVLDVHTAAGAVVAGPDGAPGCRRPEGSPTRRGRAQRFGRQSRSLRA